MNIKRTNDPIYLIALKNFMVVAIIAMAVSIVLAKLPKLPQPENTLLWSRAEHSADESRRIIMPDGSIQVMYNDLSKPFYRALYHSGDDRAYQLGVDMDQDMTVDFTVVDLDDDGYLDFRAIFCHENCEEVLHRVKLLFENGELKLEKSS